MSSGSLKDVTKAIATSDLTLPLPDGLQEVINAYLERHATRDDSDSQRLQDELLTIYQTSIVDKPSLFAPFLATLRLLKPIIRGSGRLLQWWDKLSVPVLNNIGVEKGLAAEAMNTLLEILIYDEDDGNTDIEQAKITSDTVAENLVTTWLAKSKASIEEIDEHAKFVAGLIQLTLVAFGKRRPKDFLNTINKFFVKKESRISVLSLLCEFIRHQPPHLHQLLQTPLFENLLRCLQIDTSTRVISLAMTALIMFLPHIPISASQHLPALFNIYSRMLFWDRERKAVDSKPQDDEKSEKSLEFLREDASWEKLPYLLESEDETVPELLHYFTFLYGLYPINFMSYIRKPQRYLRHANFSGADDLDIEPTEIRERSEPFRQVHLLHPNFFMLTIESELTDNNRWLKSEAADVVAECMALYNPGFDGQGTYLPSRGPSKLREENQDVPEKPLMDEDAVTPYQSLHTSWQSTAVASPDGCRSSDSHRQTCQSMPSTGNSPSMPVTDRHDSPTLPPQILPSPSNNHLMDLLNAQRSTRGSMYQALTNDSVASLALSNQEPMDVDTYLNSLVRETIPRSPSLRPSTTDPSVHVAYLLREIQLLKNDVNFERYLKQQHFSHIGQLRRKLIRKASVEAGTQNLVNSNRILRSKLDEAKRVNIQMKKENEKSKTHSRKWESELSAKLRVLREEQRKWTLEREELNRDLQTIRENYERMKQLVVTTESRELSAKQKLESVESSLEELERLRSQVEELSSRVIAFEVGEIEALRAKESEQLALQRAQILEMKLSATERQLAKSKNEFQAELLAARAAEGRDNHENWPEQRNPELTQEVLDSALSAARKRNLELQKAHNHLLKRYTSLQGSYMELKELLDQRDEDDSALLSGSLSGYGSISPSPPQGSHHKMIGPASSEPELHGHPSPPNAPFSVWPPPRLDTSNSLSRQTASPTDGRSPITGGQHFNSPQPFSSRSINNDAESLDSKGKAKIKPQSDVRVYGRGGVQNIGKNEKAKKDKAKEKELDKDGKEKKSVGLRGIRGFG